MNTETKDSRRMSQKQTSSAPLNPVNSVVLYLSVLLETVIPPFLTGLGRRIHAASFSF
jgi:hypothetical protein